MRPMVLFCPRCRVRNRFFVKLDRDPSDPAIWFACSHCHGGWIRLATMTKINRLEAGRPTRDLGECEGPA